MVFAVFFEGCLGKTEDSGGVFVVESWWDAW
jgi:hypothetical protein